MNELWQAISGWLPIMGLAGTLVLWLEMIRMMGETKHLCASLWRRMGKVEDALASMQEERNEIKDEQTRSATCARSER
jgi:hypothetical protein